jgi:LPXTG-motif cell wall-anchored protein
MTNEKEKSVFTGRPLFPYLELGILCAFVFILVIGTIQLFKTGDNNWIWIILGVSIVLVLFGLFFNTRSKTLIITKDKLRIKNFAFGQHEFEIKKVKGFDLKESYDRHGTVKDIRLWTNDKDHILFTQNNYLDIYKLVTGLKRAGVPFLGTIEIKSKYKELIKWTMIIAGLLSTLGFFLVQVMKVLR